MPDVFHGFCGPTNKDINPILDGEDTINLYPHKVDGGGTPKLPGWSLVKRPGYKPFVSLGSGAVRALFRQDQRAFAVSGIFFYEIFPNRTAALWGELAMDANPATICCNGEADGHQLFITSGGRGYIFDMDTNDLEEITDPGLELPVIMGAFSTSRFLALKAESNQWQYSDLLDGTVWPTVGVNRTSLTTDNKLAMIANHAELWFLGSARSEVWVDTGDNNIPYQPIPGTVIEGGITAKWSVARLDNTIYWVSGDERGNNMLWTANGYTPQKVSSFAIDWNLTELPTTANAIAWTYQQAGHAFYCLYVPSARFTYVFDVATGLWHKRALWNTNTVQWEPDVGQCHMWAFGKHLVGDRRIGMVYEMDLASGLKPEFAYDELAKVVTF